MPASEFRKKAVFLVGFATIVTVVLICLPFIERTFHQYLFDQFRLEMIDGGLKVGSDMVNNVSVPRGPDPGPMVNTSANLIQNLFPLIRIFLWMALVISIIRFISQAVFATAFRTSSQTEISSLVNTVLSIIIYIVSFFIIFQSQYPNVQLGALFSGSAILGIVVGLALQDTLGNLFAGIALQADKPFQVGDVVTISDRGSGVIESVSWRGVKIRTFQNKLLVMSNAVMGKETIEVAPRDNLNARLVYFNTLYANSPAKTAHVVREAIRQIENVSQKLRPVVRIKNLGDSGIEWEVKYWAEDYAKYNDTDALVRQRIWYLFNREKIEFAYPTRTIHMEPRLEETTLDDYVDATSEHLSRVPIFAPLSGEELENLAQASNTRIFAPGEAIVRKGQEGNSMFVILRGSVKVQIPENGAAKTINNLKANDYFGEMSLLTGEPRTATVVAVEETEVLQIKKTALKKIFEANPQLVKSICELIEERRLLLKAEIDEENEEKIEPQSGILRSIRKFFSLK